MGKFYLLWTSISLVGCPFPHEVNRTKMWKKLCKIPPKKKSIIHRLLWKCLQTVRSPVTFSPREESSVASLTGGCLKDPCKRLHWNAHSGKGGKVCWLVVTLRVWYKKSIAPLCVNEMSRRKALLRRPVSSTQYGNTVQEFGCMT